MHRGEEGIATHSAAEPAQTGIVPTIEKPPGSEGYRASMSRIWPVFMVTFHRLPKHPRHCVDRYDAVLRDEACQSGVGRDQVPRVGVGPRSLGACVCRAHPRAATKSCRGVVRQRRKYGEWVLSFGSNSTLFRPLSHHGRFDFRWPLDGVELGRFAPTVARLLTSETLRFGGYM